MKDLVERLRNAGTWARHADAIIASSASLNLIRDDTPFEAAAEITRLRALNAELVEALEACPLPSTMGNVKTHYDQFYDWYNKHVDPALLRAKGEA